MITLTIFNPDGVVYWTEYFNTLDAANKWIASEQMKPYWNSGNTFQIVDHSPTQKQKDDDQAVQVAHQADIAAKKLAAKNIDLSGVKNLPDLIAVVQKILDVLKSQGNL